MSATPRTIESVTRLTNSFYGNPRFRLHFTDGSSAQTQSDASCNYMVTNVIGVPVLVTFSRAGRVTDIRRENGATS